MNATTYEVEIDHGRVISRNGQTLPDKATAVLTIVSEPHPKRNPLVNDPRLTVVFHEDPAAPLTPEDWPGAFE